MKIKLILLLTLSLFGCKEWAKTNDQIDESTRATVNALDDAVDKLDENSKEWQKILNDLRRELPQTASSLMRNELKNLMQTGIAASGAEFRCNVDFISETIRNSLLNLKARLLHQNEIENLPFICQTIPSTVEYEKVINNTLKTIDFYGFNFKTKDDYKVYLSSFSNNELIDISQHLSKPAEYNLALNLSGNGVDLKNDSKSISIVSNSGSELYEIMVTKNRLPKCETDLVPIALSKKDFVPKHKQGSTDFDGHGPIVNSSIKLIPSKKNIKLELFMRAKEAINCEMMAQYLVLNIGNDMFSKFPVDEKTKKAYIKQCNSKLSIAESKTIENIYTAPDGWEIIKIEGLNNLLSTKNYTDNNHKSEDFNLGSNGPVKRLNFVGDTDGKESGSKTKMTITFNSFKVRVKKVKDCLNE